MLEKHLIHLSREPILEVRRMGLINWMIMIPSKWTWRVSALGASPQSISSALQSQVQVPVAALTHLARRDRLRLKRALKAAQPAAEPTWSRRGVLWLHMSNHGPSHVGGWRWVERCPQFMHSLVKDCT